MKDFELFGMVVLFGMTANFMYLHWRIDKMAEFYEKENKETRKSIAGLIPYMQKLRKNGPEIQQKRPVA